MNNKENQQDDTLERETLEERIKRKEARKVRARQSRNRSAWFGLGMMGTIGWMVTVPTLLGIALGIWLDHRFPSVFSWTLTLMFSGLILGCLNAWFWVSREQESMEKENRNDERDNE